MTRLNFLNHNFIDEFTIEICHIQGYSSLKNIREIVSVSGITGDPFYWWEVRTTR